MCVCIYSYTSFVYLYCILHISVERWVRGKACRRVLLCVGRFRLESRIIHVCVYEYGKENGARIADAKLNPITGRTLNNYKYAGQFITVERVPVRYRTRVD